MLYIEVEASLGDSVEEQIIPEMIALANRMQIAVQCTINDVKTTAYPNDDIARLYRAWKLGMNRPHKLAMAHMVPA